MPNIVIGLLRSHLRLLNKSIYLLHCELSIMYGFIYPLHFHLPISHLSKHPIKSDLFAASPTSLPHFRVSLWFMQLSTKMSRIRPNFLKHYDQITLWIHLSLSPCHTHQRLPLAILEITQNFLLICFSAIYFPAASRWALLLPTSVFLVANTIF